MTLERHASLTLIMLYLPFIFSLKYYYDHYFDDQLKKCIKERIEPYSAAWDLTLSIFSIFGTYHCGVYLLREGYSCNYDTNTIMWMDLFCMSKIPEFLDTVFIILKGKDLILLQYYHHFATALLTWMGNPVYPKDLVVAAFMNYLVHSVMYMYFFITSLKIHSIRKYGFLVTILQFMQMIAAVYILVTQKMESCINSEQDMTLIFNYSIIMYCSYVFLFGKLLMEKISYTQTLNTRMGEKAQ